MKKTTFTKLRLFLVLLVGTCLFLPRPAIAQTGPAPVPEGYIHSISDVGKIHFIQHSITEYETGRYVVAGTVTPGAISGDSDILVLMADDAGSIVWSKYLTYDADEFAGSVMVDAEGSIVLTGYMGDNGSAFKNLIIVKLDGNGNLLDDVVIGDTNLNYGLYGLDIEQTTEEGAYIVVGTGVQAATENAPKYAFVLRVDNRLNKIEWSKIYRSDQPPIGFPPGPTNYDSFNHILKVPDHPTYGECFLLSGSGAMPNTTRQMTANLLIDQTGLDLWGNPRNYGRSTGVYDFPATMALYSEFEDEFYVLHTDLETGPALLRLDGTSGLQPLTDGNQLIIGNFNYILNGMAWRDPEKEHIVFSGYHIGGITPTGNAHFVNMDVSSPPPYPFTYTSYDFFFHGGALQSIPFDFIVKPFNRGGGFYNQIYYQPKSLVTIPNTGCRFTNPQDIYGYFGLNLFKTDLDGGLDDIECFEREATQTETWLMQPFSNFNSLPYSFDVIGSGVQIFSADLMDEYACGEPQTQQRPFMGINEIKREGNIETYPNPATDVLYISGLADTNNPTITLYDLQGREVLSKNHQSGNEAQLDVSTLQSGLYFLKLSEGGESVFVKRVILQ